MHTCIKVAPDAGMQNYAYSVVANNVCQSDACGGENNGVAPPQVFGCGYFCTRRLYYQCIGLVAGQLYDVLRVTYITKRSFIIRSLYREKSVLF